MPVFERREAVPIPCGGGPIARLLIRPPQPTPNGRIGLSSGRPAPRPRNRISPGSRRIRVSGAILRRKLDGIQFFSAHTYHMNFRSRPNSTKRDHCGPGRPIHSTVPTPVRPSTTAHMAKHCNGPYACRLPANQTPSSSAQLCGALHARAVRGGALCGARGRVGGGGGHCRRADRVPAGKGTEAVSTCAYKLMGWASARGSAHLRSKRSSGRRHLRGGGRAERAEEPTLLIGPSIRAREA